MQPPTLHHWPQHSFKFCSAHWTSFALLIPVAEYIHAYIVALAAAAAERVWLSKGKVRTITSAVNQPCITSLCVYVYVC
jgi:hypothetical protein